MSIQYYADDGTIKNLGDNELQHWKYIKKIKSGNGYRYFYSQDEIDAFKKEVQDTWRYAKPQKPSTMRKKVNNDAIKEYEKHRSVNNKLRKQRKETMRRDYDLIDRRGKMSIEDYSSEKDELRKRIKRDKKNFDKEWDRHNEASKKISDRSYNATRYEKAVNAPYKTIKTASKKVDKGKSAVEKKLNKAKKTVKNEAKGVKRASNAIRGKGDNFYDGSGAKKYRKYKYDKKKGYYTQRGKAKKTGKIERGMINAYRKTHPYE